MRSKIIVLVLVVFGLCAIGIRGSAVADSPPPTAGKITLGVTVSEAELIATGWRVSKLLGAQVENDNAAKIGKVDDIVVAPGGQLSIAVIEVGGFLGIGSHRVAIPVHEIRFSRDPSKIVLPGASKEALKALPEFKYTS